MHAHQISFEISFLCRIMILALVVIGVTPAWSEVVLQDEFNGDTLDPGWDIMLLDATGWTYEVAGGYLTVTDVAFDSYHGGWSYVFLSQEFDWIEDFEVTCAYGWDSESSNRAMQTFTVALVDTSRTRVVSASYHDPWDQSRGHITAIVGDEQYYPSPNMLEHSGEGTFTFRRVDGVVTILWNDQEVLSGPFLTPIFRLELRFMSGAWETAIFGSFSVDQIMCSGDAWPTAIENGTWGGVKALYQ